MMLQNNKSVRMMVVAGVVLMMVAISAIVGCNGEGVATEQNEVSELAGSAVFYCEEGVFGAGEETITMMQNGEIVKTWKQAQGMLQGRATLANSITASLEWKGGDFLAVVDGFKWNNEYDGTWATRAMNAFDGLGDVRVVAPDEDEQEKFTLTCREDASRGNGRLVEMINTSGEVVDWKFVGSMYYGLWNPCDYILGEMRAAGGAGVEWDVPLPRGQAETAMGGLVGIFVR